MSETLQRLIQQIVQHHLEVKGTVEASPFLTFKPTSHGTTGWFNKYFIPVTLKISPIVHPLHASAITNWEKDQYSWPPY